MSGRASVGSPGYFNPGSSPGRMGARLPSVEIQSPPVVINSPKKEQTRIKESNFEEEISILKNQLSHHQKQTVTENIEIIRVQRENKIRTAENQSLKVAKQ